MSDSLNLDIFNTGEGPESIFTALPLVIDYCNFLYQASIGFILVANNITIWLKKFPVGILKIGYHIPPRHVCLKGWKDNISKITTILYMNIYLEPLYSM